LWFQDVAIVEILGEVGVRVVVGVAGLEVPVVHVVVVAVVVPSAVVAAVVRNGWLL